ncbi:hypothetical protein DPMN_148904 [Dreissena polymorpha]|uniref:Uncharacterized protein n=1 Tax=Dreissena polymorpha TaxID=45954 RepID=A0A9D4FAG2_DREPO|nr:hypothetical protein DPMN_148904 [Dreissena polymorpha]
MESSTLNICPVLETETAYPIAITSISTTDIENDAFVYLLARCKILGETCQVLLV